MRIGISGTYSSGKTFTSMALSHYTGLPRTRARTMREILPEAAPGKTLEECTAAELIQMIVTRHVERAVYEDKLSDGFVSDGSSLQEWIYGSVRVSLGLNPSSSAQLKDGETVEKTAELAFFEEVMLSLGNSFKRHVKSSFDVFVHLKNELPLSADGHRPVNDQFRNMSDAILQRTMNELGIPFHVVSGSVEERIAQIAALFNLETQMTPEAAVEMASAEYALLDVRPEQDRVLQ
ncbi:ATP/GTP-binding protein (plasmid) [Arthrobacter alpinus]|uniref:AAA family ATPase n=1 Tax=Arthrobacter alpinus TaxID=656366 RepID=UPI0005CADC86|nr:AAA family ATPase [Arthrobacter alpinus]ALV47811.1 ATP/GTP-binding protein [Arthrobacter alpinus]ALV47951.1 ATP/GTP-binding protein [Arthrobacter alpinus]